MALKGLAELALRNAKEALERGNPAQALEWLEKVSGSERPPDLNAEIHYHLGKHAAAHEAWSPAGDHFRAANQLLRVGLYGERVRAHQGRVPLMEVELWESLETKINPATRLPPDFLSPDVAGVWACGAYYSRGALSTTPWSQLLRLAKQPDPEHDHEPAAEIASNYLGRFLLRKTPIVGQVDAIVSIPANPLRFAKRMMSLPDELARGIERQLGIPYLFGGLRSTAKEMELRGLSWSERRRAVRNSMVSGDLGVAAERSLLIIDDVITSGATMREAARVLREAGAQTVFGAALCHTEG